jgi:hypothetical protein
VAQHPGLADPAADHWVAYSYGMTPKMPALGLTRKAALLGKDLIGRSGMKTQKNIPLSRYLTTTTKRMLVRLKSRRFC